MKVVLLLAAASCLVGCAGPQTQEEADRAYRAGQILQQGARDMREVNRPPANQPAQPTNCTSYKIGNRVQTDCF